MRPGSSYGLWPETSLPLPQFFIIFSQLGGILWADDCSGAALGDPHKRKTREEHMIHGRFWHGLLLIVVVVGLLAMAGGAGYRAGLSQGAMAQWWAETGARNGAPLPPMMYPGYGAAPFLFARPHLFGFGHVLALGLLLLLIFAAFRAMAFHRWTHWAAAGGPGGGADAAAGGPAGGPPPWARRWAAHHGFRPDGPRCCWGAPEGHGPEARPAEPAAQPRPADAPKPPTEPASNPGDAPTNG